MQIRITSSDISLTPELRAFIEKKIGTLAHFLKHLEEKGDVLVDVEISRRTKHHQTGEIFYAEANISVPGKILRGESYAKDIQMAINSLRHILKVEMVEYKEQFRPNKIHKERREHNTSEML